MKYINPFSKKLVIAMVNIVIVSMVFVYIDALCQWAMSKDSFSNILAADRSQVLKWICIIIQSVIYLMNAVLQDADEKQ